jgi:histidyl-tRNA synthetase
VGAGVGAIGGGGRYDGLMELEGGRPTPGLGFAVGFERIYLALQSLGVDLAGEPEPCVFVACTPDAREAAFDAPLALRHAGIRTEADYQGRSMKAQFKQANRLGARLCVVLGTDEVAQGLATLRDMSSHEQVQVPLSELAREAQARI